MEPNSTPAFECGISAVRPCNEPDRGFGESKGLVYANLAAITVRVSSSQTQVETALDAASVFLRKSLPAMFGEDGIKLTKIRHNGDKDIVASLRASEWALAYSSAGPRECTINVVMVHTPDYVTLGNDMASFHAALGAVMVEQKIKLNPHEDAIFDPKRINRYGRMCE